MVQLVVQLGSPCWICWGVQLGLLLLLLPRLYCSGGLLYSGSASLQSGALAAYSGVHWWTFVQLGLILRQEWKTTIIQLTVILMKEQTVKINIEILYLYIDFN